jgi:hypothetical protein
MDDVSANLERTLLTRLRLAVWATVGMALIAITSAIALLVFQYAHVTKTPNPGDAGQVKAVKVDGFLKQLEQIPFLPGAASGRYLQEAKQIVACSRDSNGKSGLDTTAFTPTLAEVFRLELERVADSPRDERGGAYVADAVRFFCLVLNQPAVIAYKKNHSEEHLFDAVINYHLTQWDQLKDEIRRFRQDEQVRALNATVKEELRIVKAQSGILAALCIAGVALGLLMVAALYFVLTRMEFKLQGLHRMVESLNPTGTLVTASSVVSEASTPFPPQPGLGAPIANASQETA